MTVIDIIAKELQMNPDELLKESLRTYLERRISQIEAEIFLLAKKYGIKDVSELNAKINAGVVSESQAYDDYFRLDNLEAEQEKLKKILENL